MALLEEWRCEPCLQDFSQLVYLVTHIDQVHPNTMVDVRGRLQVDPLRRRDVEAPSPTETRETVKAKRKAAKTPAAKTAKGKPRRR